jgi:LPXTG-motif cell wall-anchored protein
MTFLRAAPAVFCAALIGTALSPSVKADDWNRKTVVTFNEPVETPGVHIKGWAVLPAGTYVFKILDSKSDRHIVQILSQDELTVYATILAIPNYRLKATDKTVMTFRERPAGEPEALRAWFYPGRLWGEEFVYPKARAIVLAKETHTAVLFAPDEVTPEVTVAVKTPEEPVVVELEKAPVKAIQPTGEEVEIAQVVTAPPATTEVAQAEPAPAAALPATGSSMPLVALFGMLALAGGLAMSLLQKRAL